MQSKLTLRMDQAVITKAKRMARQRGTSVSKVFSEYITQSAEESDLPPMGATTASMLGVLRGTDLEDDKQVYREHLESKHL